MVCGMLCTRGTHSSDKFCVVAKLLKHTRVFAANGAVDEGRSGSVGDSSGSSDSNCAVDDGQARIEEINVARSFGDEVLNVERIADVQNVHGSHWRIGWRNVYTDHVIVL